MKLVMQKLNIKVPSYDWYSDPLLRLQTPFSDEEKTQLKRVLLFQDQSRSDTNKLSLRESPNLISEISDDPETKQVKMRIRINTHPSLVKQIDDQTKLDEKPIDMKSSIDLNASIPGWLGKSLTSGKNPASKRKRHGNKGKRRGSKRVELSLNDDDIISHEKEETSENSCSATASIIEKMFPKNEITIKTES